MRHIPATHLRTEAQKHHFRRYMAKFRAIFRSKSAHGSKFPWDGSADPWDGNRNPRDGSTKGPLPAAFPTLKGGRRRTSALTVCHIAHKAVGHFRRRSRGHPVARAVALGGAAFLPPENARGASPAEAYFPVVGRSEGVGRRVVFSHGSNVHAAGLTAPWGPNYSITAGKRSAPAVRTPPTSSAPRGSNAREACQARRHSIG